MCERVERWTKAERNVPKRVDQPREDDVVGSHEESRRDNEGRDPFRPKPKREQCPSAQRLLSLLPPFIRAFAVVEKNDSLS